MNDTKIKRLKETDWVVGDAGDFLHLDTDEIEFIELKLNLARSIRALRESRSMTRTQFARAIGSRRSTIVNMEAAEPSVNIDVMVSSLLKAGARRWDIARAIES